MKLRIIVGLMAVVFAAGCSTAKHEAQVEDSLDDTIHCDTAEGDIRALKSEKRHAADQAAAGVQAIVPVSALVHMVQGTEDTQFRVMIGDYDKAIDKRIAQIKDACNIQ